MKRFFFELLKVVIFILIFCKGVGLLFGKECVGESKKVKCGRKNKSPDQKFVVIIGKGA